MKSLSNNPNVYTSGDLSHYFLPPSPSPDSISNHSQWPFSGHFSIPSPPPVQESTSAAAVSGGDDGAASSPVDVGCCVAVALNKTPADTLASSAVSPLPNQTPVAMDTSQLGSQYDAEGKALASSKAPSNHSGRMVGSPPMPYRQLKTSGQGRQATSESSSKDSDSDDLGGDIKIPDNLDPAEARYVRRKLSNRESARRSRRKKQEQMTELQTQVDQLKVEKSTLLKQLNDINQKRDGAAIDNRIMKADIETLRAKVKMAEETVKRFTGMNLMPFVMNKAPKTGMPNAGVVDSTTATSYSQQTWNQCLKRPLQNVPITGTVHENLQSGLTDDSITLLLRNQLNYAVQHGIDGINTMQNFADSENQQTQSHTQHDNNSSLITGATEPDLSHVLTKKR